MTRPEKTTRAQRRKLANIMEGQAECHVSERWLQFSSNAQLNPDGSGGYDELLFLDVMTKNREGKEKKICELVLDRRDLVAILERMPVKPCPTL